MSSISDYEQGRLQYRDAYAANVTYFPNNLVTYNNSIYICIKQSIGNVPTNAVYFSLFTTVPSISVTTVGSGVTPSSFTLTSDGSTITLNKPS